MSSIHDVFKCDDVRGVIIGSDYVTGQLYYDTRKQGQQIYADNLDQLRDKATKLKQELISDCGEVSYLIYPKNTWQLKIFN